MDINTCIFYGKGYHHIAYYSHLIPIFLGLLLVVFVLVASKFSLVAKLFSLFVVSFCLWLVGDLVTWVSNDYHLVAAIWGPLDYINVIFYLFGAYFFTVLVKDGEKIPTWLKMSFIVLSMPAWWITVTGQSITGFDQTQCEAFNNGWLTNYKFIVEWVVCLYIILTARNTFRKSDRAKKIQISVVTSALLLFFMTFSVTENIGSQTGLYEINLYSLSVLPIFLGMIIYAITKLKMFQVRLIATQLLVYVLLIMVGSQLFFIENIAHNILMIVSFVTSIFFGFVLLIKVRKENNQLEQIEILATNLHNTNTNLENANDRLKEIDKQKTEFVSFATHQLRSPLTAMRGYTSLILEGDYGDINTDLRTAIERISESSKTLTVVVNDFLNLSSIELGTMKYNFQPTDLKGLVKNVIDELQPNINKSGLKFTFEVNAQSRYFVNIDTDKFKQVIGNIIDNSIKYTPTGSITVSVTKDVAKNTILFAIKDTGIGMGADIISKLFTKFSRAENANKINIRGTGLGLFVAKEIVKVHNGRVWGESEGEGKGSQFYVELLGEK